MTMRILNRQRQLAEQGRLRLGYTVPAKTKDGRDTIRPVRSETWIATSHSKEHIETAATLWGGNVEHWEPMGNGAKQWRVITTTNAIPAILPPGDPLTSAYETWTKGGCQRRCNGVTEELSGSPCICIAQHGEQWYELSSREVCVSKSRLKVLLPDMPGLGSWRMETGSFYATDEIAGMVDTIRGAVGDNVLIPITLRIEPRTRVAGGETKQFVVPVVELRGVTAGALLSGAAVETGALRSANLDSTKPAALQAKAPAATDFRGLADVAPDLDTIRAIWKEASAAGVLDDDLKGYLTGKGNALQKPSEAGGQPVAGETSVGGASPAAEQPEVGEDPDDAEAALIWQQCVDTAGAIGWSLSTLQSDFEKRMGMGAAVASAAELAVYLQQVKGETADEQVPA